jgi:hypothetical protein
MIREFRRTKPDELPGSQGGEGEYRRKLQVGIRWPEGTETKVISQCEEDMPYLPDGTPVDMILNPLGVPSRMNVGQVLETHLGWAAKELGNQVNAIMEREFSPQALKAKLKDIYKSTKAEKLIDKMDDDDVANVAGRLRKGIPVQSPVFDGASEEEIKNMLAAAGLPEDGKTILFDGQTGEPFDQKVTVGVMYMLKLHHLVEEDPREGDRAVLPRYTAAARRESPFRRPAPRGNGGLGARSVRGFIHAPGISDCKIGRRNRQNQDFRFDRQG